MSSVCRKRNHADFVTFHISIEFGNTALHHNAAYFAYGVVFVACLHLKYIHLSLHKLYARITKEAPHLDPC
jgi:hypothetical protein